MKHQIIPLGKDMTTIYLGIKKYAPDVIHLLTTAETDGLYFPMLSMLSKTIQVHTYEVFPYDGVGVVNICKYIHDRFEGEFSYNLSEGTKVMAIAALRVAFDKKAFPFYISQRGTIVNLLTFEREQLTEIVDNKEFISLYGSTLESYNDIKFLSEDDISTSENIKYFIENYNREYEKIHKYFRQECRRHTENMPPLFTLPGKIEVAVVQGKMTIAIKGKVVLKSANEKTNLLFFTGRWWETLVAARIKEWMKGKKNAPEAWQSVIFESDEESNKVKNEIDILVNNDQKLLLIECKSGWISQENIYKIDSVRETYGGDSSKAILVSYYPLDPFLQEKCKDLHVHFFAPSTCEERVNHLDRLSQWLDNIINITEI